MEEQSVRWSIKVSKDTDLALRTFLDSQARNPDSDPDEIQLIVDEAVSEVRAERRNLENSGSWPARCMSTKCARRCASQESSI
jgi:hypothetical protein